MTIKTWSRIRSFQAIATRAQGKNDGISKLPTPYKLLTLPLSHFRFFIFICFSATFFLKGPKAITALTKFCMQEWKSQNTHKRNAKFGSQFEVRN